MTVEKFIEVVVCLYVFAVMTLFGLVIVQHVNRQQIIAAFKAELQRRRQFRRARLRRGGLW